MKYKLRSSSKNSTESKSTYHSSGSSSSRGMSSEPAEKRQRLEHEVHAPIRGAGHNLRRKPWAPSLISIETQTDERMIGNIPSISPPKCVENNDKCLKVCELCGCSSRKRRYQKIEAPEVHTNKDVNIEEESVESDKTKTIEDLRLVANVSERLDVFPALRDNEDKPTVKALPLEVRIVLHNRFF